MGEAFKKVLVLIMLVAMLASAMPALGEEATAEPGETAPTEVGEVDLYDSTVYAGGCAEMETDIGPSPCGDAFKAPAVPEGNGAMGVTVRNVTIHATETYHTRVTFDAPYGGYLYCASSNTSVMQCGWSDDWDGAGTTLNIYGVAAGTATVTLTNTVDSEAIYIYVTVLPAVTVSPDNVTVKVGEKTAVTITFYGYGVLTFHNPDNTCACNWDSEWYNGTIRLFITGVNAGTTTIRVTNDVNSDYCDVRVTVTGPSYPKKGRKDGKQNNRALLVGEGAFKEPATRMRIDATMMTNMLKTVKGAKGSKWTTTTRYDLSNESLKKAIYNAFKKADEDDVSMLFISTHGYINGTGSEAGMLSLIPEGQEYIAFCELAEVLRAVPGKVIVLLTSCGSGAAIFSTYSEQNDARNAMKDAAKARDHAAIKAFADADPGIGDIPAFGSVNMYGEAVNTGELRVANKFYVLTASRYQETSWGVESRPGPYTYFAKWFTDGVGTSGRMPADANKNGKLTLNEMFKYISRVGDNFRVKDESGIIHYQHVQVYPRNSSFVLFKR